MSAPPSSSQRHPNIPLSLLDPTLAKFAENCRMIEPTQDIVNQARDLLNNGHLRNRGFMSTINCLVPEIIDERPLSLNEHPVFIMQIENMATEEVGRQYNTLIDHFKLWQDNTSVHPCIAVTVVWSHISFAGFALGPGNSGIFTEVFSLASMNFHPQDFNSIKHLARHLSALQIAINDFKDRIANGTFTLPVPLARAYPYPNEFFYLRTKLTTIVYREPMCGEKLLFKGLINNSKFVCIKFTQSYGRDVHEWCEEQGWAPELLGFEILPNGWIMVVMEYLDKDSWVTFSDVSLYVKDLVVDEIQNALEKLHENGMVHGDIKGLNIMVEPRKTEFKLIDFDWSGLKGIAKYPITVGLAEHLGRPSDVCYNADILPEHDMYMWNGIISLFGLF